MKKIILFLRGVFLLLAASVTAAETAQCQTPKMELINVEYDYHFKEGYYYEPMNQHFEPDIVGQLTMTFKIKHIQSFRVERSEGHYLIPDEAPANASIPMFCAFEDETVNVSMPIIMWGTWVRCFYENPETGEYIYTPKVWTTDYIDPETLSLVLGEINTINENENDISISLNGKALSISNSQGYPTHIELYTTQGQQMLSLSLEQDSTISLEHIENGIYILNLVSSHKNISKKIILR